MRKILCTALLPLMISTPIAAQEAEPTLEQDNYIASQPLSAEQSLEQLSDKLENPALQDTVANTVEKMTNVMLQFPVGQFVEIIEETRPGTVKQPIDADATISDLAAENITELPEKFADESRKAMNIMSSLTGVFAQFIPELKDATVQLEEAIKQPSSQ